MFRDFERKPKGVGQKPGFTGGVVHEQGERDTCISTAQHRHDCGVCL